MNKRNSILALLLVGASALTACSSKGVPSSPSGTTASEDTTTAAEEISPLDSLNYGGQTITLYVRDDLGFEEFNVEEEAGDVVNDALVKRNRKVSERLNVKLEFFKQADGFANRQTFSSVLSQSIMAGDSAYDIVAGYSMSVAYMAADGMLCDLTSTAYMDFSKPWWSDSLLSESAINGKLYFASGDISIAMLNYLNCTFFNKEMIADFNLENPYELVDNGTWTLDKMAEMCTGIYSDLNGNNEKDAADRFGFVTKAKYLDAFWFSAGLTYTETDEAGQLVISDDLVGEKAAELVEKLCGLLHDTNDFMISEEGKIFKEGNVLFHSNDLKLASPTLRDATFEYGLLPVPKYDESDNYVTTPSFGVTLYGIPLDAKDIDMSSAVLEALAEEGYNTVSPALFEVAMKVKYSSDDDSSRMYDIIRENISFDFGRIFNDNLNGKTYGIFRDALVTNTSTWSSTVASEAEAVQTMLTSLLENFE
ncbi:MAG: hypothetical protein IJ493_09750 [Clostridia bacterium]|nr:hypothetical protein [Clostridia bacterium]